MLRITIYDSDDITEENLLRHTLNGFWVDCSKVIGLKCELEQVHPEINVRQVNKNIDEETIKKEINKFDLIIFTVGSSDIQLKLNRILKDEKCKAKTIFCWLEAGGENSHVLFIDYSKSG